MSDTPVTTEHHRTIIIGSGFAGLCMAIKLHQKGDDDYVVLERAGDVGGTWRDNSYPGAACDVPSHLYSFSFAPNPDWSAYYAPGGEIHRYIQKVVADTGIADHIRLDCPMQACRWDDAAALWRVTTPEGEMTATWLVCGAGSLAEPKLPEIPGLDAFEGEILHSARWNHDLDLSQMRVAIVGTGASAIQVVPGLAGRVKEMVVFQRTPAWVIPRRTTPYTKAQQRMFERAPQVMQRERDDIFWMAEAGYAARRAVPASLEVTRAQAEGNIARAISDESLRARLTPNYTPGCKRILSSNTYYPAFARDDVHLEDSALASVDGKVAVAASSNRYEVDAIVLCTGFETTEPPFAHQIIDASGRTLAESWHDGMAALDSTAVAGFPNLFTLVGPNTNLGHNSIIYMIESQVSYVLGAMERAERDGLDWIMPSDEAQVAYVDSMQEQAAGTVWLRAGGCHSWYVDPRSGKLTQLWPDYAWDFRARNAHFTGDGFLTRTAAGERQLEHEEPQVGASFL